MTTFRGVECPHCSEETLVLIPSESEPITTSTEMTSSLMEEADTAVRTSCSNDNEFVVYLSKR